MTPCRQWSELLIDHALGGPAGPPLDRHVAGCRACSEALAAWRARSQQMDSALRQLRAPEPPPYGPERVLARIEAAPPQRFARYLAFGTLLGAVIFAACLLVLSRRKRPENTEAIPVVSLSTWRSPTESLLRSPGDPLLKGVPRLGETWLQTKGSGDKHAQ